MSKTGVNVEGLSFAYPQQEPVFQNVSFSLKPGDRIALLGPTGTGKTTLLEHLVGLKIPQTGQIWIENILLQPANLPQIRTKVGFAFQDPADQLFMPTLLEDITFGPRNYGITSMEAKAKASKLLAEFGLEKYAHRPANQLSGGQKRLAALAAVLALKPSILILDEPTAGLDPLWRRHLAKILPQLPVEILLIASHDLHWVSKVTQRALVLAKGNIQADKEIQALLKDGATLESYGLPLDY